MKKYVWLGCVTAAALVALFFMNRQQEAPRVATEQLVWQQMEQTVQVSGKVEEATRDVLAVVAPNGGKVQIRVAIPENRLKLVQVGQRVVVSGAAFSAEGYGGAVVSLGDKAYTGATGGTMVDAVIALDNFDSSLKCGLSAKAGICVNTLEGVLVPYQSVMADEEGQEYVYILRDGRAVRQDITEATELLEGLFVTNGLAAGERLITEPQSVSAGAAVRAEEDHD